MKLTNTADGSIIDTDQLDDQTAELTERLNDFKEFCIAHNIPFILHALTETGSFRSHTAFSVHHATEDKETVTMRLFHVAHEWWSKVFPSYTLALIKKDLLDEKGESPQDYGD